MLESLDDGVGRVVATLKELGLTENTLVIFTSDNGGVGLPELGPTPTNLAPLLDLIGQPIPVPDMPDGRSFGPLLTTPSASLDRGAIFWHYPHVSNQLGRPAGAVRQGDWKLVIENYETGQYELFNLGNDLGELDDLSTKNSTKTAELAKLLSNWRQAVGATMPVRKKK